MNELPIEKIDFTGAYTVARAGLLKAKLQALSNVLIRTPFHRHKQLQFDVILQGTSSCTHVQGSEEVYFCTKGLKRPDDIPDLYVRAYTEVLGSRHFTNIRLVRYSDSSRRTVTRFGPTFSDVRTLLVALDAICDTSLEEIFSSAEQTLKPLPFLRLPYELRLQVYDCLIPHLAYIPMFSRKYTRTDRSLPENLAIMRTNKQIHDEIDKHCFDRHVLLLKASRVTGLASTQNHFACDTSKDYADRYTSIARSKIRHRITQLEIQILPTEESLEDTLRESWSMADKVSLRQICSVLPNLESILFSYPKPDPRSIALIDELWKSVKPHMKGSPCNRNRKVTLEWISNQLWLTAGAPPRILWDLTYFRESVENVKKLRRDIFSERMMKDLIKQDGGLEQARSVASTKEDSQRWTEVRAAVLEALKRE